MSNSPYRGLPSFAWWKAGVVESNELHPIATAKFRIDRDTKIATCGSCFAQHLGPALVRGGHSYFVAEPAPALFKPEEARDYHYGIFSARFGNVYTSRAFCQVLERAFGVSSSDEPPWNTERGRVIDPLRPGVHPGGFSNVHEMLFDRGHHEASVRALVENLDVLVFTLGLTEMWERRSDGTALPACPGTIGGSYDPELYAFRNLSYEEVVADLERAVTLISRHNPRAKLLLSVSPVPLIASYSGDHVLAATTRSKSVLRAAAEALRQRHAQVDYLPAFEIVANPWRRERYFADDLRSVRPEGVAAVMRCFFAAFSSDPPRPDEHRKPDSSSIAAREDDDLIAVLCDEDRLREAYGDSA